MSVSEVMSTGAAPLMETKRRRRRCLYDIGAMHNGTLLLHVKWDAIVYNISVI